MRTVGTEFESRTQGPARGASDATRARAEGVPLELTDDRACPGWHEGSRLRAWTAALVDRLWLRELTGLERLPAREAFVIAAPHASYMDFFAMAALFEVHLGRRLRFWAKTRMMRHPFVGHYCRVSGCLEVGERAFQGRLWRHSMECLLEHREPLCIFPEGTRSVTGQPGKFRPGYLKLASEAGVPVVPVRISNTHSIWPPGRRLPRAGRIDLHVEEPLWVERGASGSSLRELNRRVQRACCGAES